METSELRKEMIERINEIEDEQQLLRIEAMIENLLAASSKTDFWDELPEEAKKGIEAGQKDFQEGRWYSHEEAMKEVNKLFPNP